MKNRKYFEIGGKKIGRKFSPLIIAEMSGNHNQSLDRALDIVNAAAQSGAHALKIQTYTADTMTLDMDTDDFCIDDRTSLWNKYKLYDLYQEAHTPWEWHQPIMQRASELGLIVFSTPFDETAVDFLESLGTPAYKIASFEIIHLPLIQRVAETGKPLIISTGMASVSEIGDAVSTARQAGCDQLCLLKCTSTYPATPENSNVLSIPHMRKLFNCEVGISDHTAGIGASVAAIAHGATIVEKHFTISRAEGGVDSAFSLEPFELNALVIETSRAWQSLGEVKYGPGDSEKKSIIFRRSIYIAEDMSKGDIFTKENLRCIRPGFGLSPKYYHDMLGRRVNKSTKKGTPLRWDLIG